jgi:hypothetical protein
MQLKQMMIGRLTEALNILDVDDAAIRIVLPT